MTMRGSRVWSYKSVRVNVMLSPRHGSFSSSVRKKDGHQPSCIYIYMYTLYVYTYVIQYI